MDVRIEGYPDGGGPKANARAEKARLMNKSGFFELGSAPELSKADLNGRDAASFDYLIDRGDQTWYSITVWMGYESGGGSTIARVTLSYLYSISIEEQQATTPVLTRALRAVEI